MPAFPRLTLVGTVHRDPQGYERLLTLLEELHPDLVTLEMSPYALRYRQRRGRAQLLRLDRILDHLAEEVGELREALADLPAISDIRTLLALPFEYLAASRYCRDHGGQPELIDSSEVSTRKLNLVEKELVSDHNIRVLVRLPAEARNLPWENYRIAQGMICLQPSAETCRRFLASRRGAEGIGPRDARMAEQIRLHMKHARHLVHIGGWVHLVADEQGETLFSRLADLRPERLLLGGDGR